MLAANCARVTPTPDPVQPAIPGADEVTDAPIVFSATTGSETKAFVSASNLNTNGNSIKIYDILSLKQGKVTYIDDALSYGSSWAPSKQYYWTRTGTHKFFGWFVKQMQGSNELTAEDLFGTDGLTYSESGDGLNPTSFTLTTSQIAIDERTPQFDFLYSNIIKRTMDNQATPQSEFAQVNLDMNHLFTAFSVSATNTLNADVTIRTVEIQGLKNKKNALIDFSSDTRATVSYQNASHTASLKSTYVADPGLVIRANAERNASAPDIISGRNADTPYIFWPQTEEEITPGDFSFDPVTGEANYNPEDPLLIVKYKVGNGNERTLLFSLLDAVKAFDNKELQAGSIYHFDIVFADRFIKLICDVQPWDKTTTTIDYNDGTIIYAENGKLAFDTEASIVNGNTVTIKDGMPAIGTFKLQSPIGATWVVHLNGDFNAFGVEPVGSDLIDGINWSSFRVVPKIQSPSKQYKVTVSINLRLSDGRMINADEELQPDTFQIILPEA